MSRQFQHRVAAIVLSGLVFGGPLLASGPASAEQLRPDSPLRADVRPVLVTAPSPAPATTDPSSTDLANVPPGSVAPSRTGAGLPRRTAPNDHPLRSSHKATHRRGAARSVPTSAHAMPLDAAAPGIKAKIKTKIQVRATPRTAGSRAPAYAGTPRDGADTLPLRVPSPDLVPLSRGAVPAPGVPPPATDIAAKPMARVQPMPDSRSVGLLGLIAVVCVMGVGAAAIRAIVSGRANRSKFA